jgi:t-SNARE complex subunit (syntaxin)
MPDVKILKQCKSISNTLETLQVEASQPRASLTLTGLNSDFRERLDAVDGSISRLESSTAAGDPINTKHIKKVRKQFRTTSHFFENLEASERNDIKTTTVRQCLAINPDATNEQIDAAKEQAFRDPDAPLFSLAVSAVKPQGN